MLFTGLKYNAACWTTSTNLSINKAVVATLVYPPTLPAVADGTALGPGSVGAVITGAAVAKRVARNSSSHACCLLVKTGGTSSV